jgi:GntR family histidine utilization transcriptional repressor
MPYTYLMEISPLTAGEHRGSGQRQRRSANCCNWRSMNPACLIHRRTWSGSRIVTSARLVYPGSRYQLFGRFTSHG